MKSSHYSPDVFYEEASVYKKPPTEKQKTVFKGLCKKCRENGLSERTGLAMHSRADYQRAIGILVKRLQGAGVVLKGKEDLDEET